MPRVLAALLALAGLAASACAQPADAPTAVPPRAVAVTLDDLPFGGGQLAVGCDAPALLALHGRLLGHLAAHGAPAIGFVNEGRACDALPAGTLETILTRWLDAGHALGNHTATHPDYNRTPLDTFAADVVRGEALTQRLLDARGQRLRYFRHPFLRTGDTPEEKAALAAFLEARGYTVAPVTLDNDEWVFAAAYARAVSAGDTSAARRLRTEYLAWFDGLAAHFEGWSAEVLGYEPPQVLLLHANLLNADALGDLLAVFARRGYRFVSLDEALMDPAYARPDPYVGQRGVSWLHRWAGGEGREIRREPAAPEWVSAYARGEG